MKGLFLNGLLMNGRSGMRYSTHQDLKGYRDLIIDIIAVVAAMMLWGVLMATPVL